MPVLTHNAGPTLGPPHGELGGRSEARHVCTHPVPGPRPLPCILPASLGAVLAFLMVVASLQHDTVAALWLFLAAMVVDGTDGLLARRLRVKEVIPWFDGPSWTTSSTTSPTSSRRSCCSDRGCTLRRPHRLADRSPAAARVDVPVLPERRQDQEDHFFMGFPSYWNVVAFYVLVLDLPVAAVTASLVVLAVLVFVPVKYVYPSRTPTWWYTNMAATAAWFVAYVFIVAQLPDPAPWLVGLSLSMSASSGVAHPHLPAQATRAAEPVIGTASA